jgi:hypothetical protein
MPRIGRPETTAVGCGAAHLLPQDRSTLIQLSAFDVDVVSKTTAAAIIEQIFISSLLLFGLNSQVHPK